MSAIIDTNALLMKKYCTKDNGELYLYPDYANKKDLILEWIYNHDTASTNEIVSGSRKPLKVDVNVGPNDIESFLVKPERPKNDFYLRNSKFQSEYGTLKEISIARILSHIEFEDDLLRISFEEPYGFYQTKEQKGYAIFKYYNSAPNVSIDQSSIDQIIEIVSTKDSQVPKAVQEYRSKLKKHKLDIYLFEKFKKKYKIPTHNTSQIAQLWSYLDNTKYTPRSASYTELLNNVFDCRIEDIRENWFGNNTSKILYLVNGIMDNENDSFLFTNSPHSKNHFIGYDSEFHSFVTLEKANEIILQRLLHVNSLRYEKLEENYLQMPYGNPISPKWEHINLRLKIDRDFGLKNSEDLSNLPWKDKVKIAFEQAKEVNSNLANRYKKILEPTGFFEDGIEPSTGYNLAQQIKNMDLNLYLI